MGKSKNGGENSKKAQGNARKAAAADEKTKKEQAKLESLEDAKWEEGAKGKSKKDQEADKKAEVARKKAEREAQLKAEEEQLPDKAPKKGRGADKVANRRTGKIDDFVDSNKDTMSLSASNIDDAIDALSVTTGKSTDPKEVERHPERRVKKAHADFEERRLPELRKEQPGLRLNQYKELVWKEFQKSNENPFNQVNNVSHNATREEVAEKKKSLKKGKEIRLGV